MRYLIHHFVEAVAAADPDRVFLLGEGVCRSYGEVDAAANRIANLLRRRGLVAGDRVGLLCKNGPEYVEAYYAILKAGGVAVPLNTAANAAQLREFLGD